MKKKILAWVAAAALTVSALPHVILAAEPETYATRGQVVEMLLGAADDYTPNLQKNMIVKGYADGSVKEEQYITRAESFVMLSRAFGTLPEPKGNDARISPKNVQYDGVPEWARADVENLVRGGVLMGSDDGLLHGDDNVTVEQVSTVIRRIWALKGSNLKDDFYATANKAELDSSMIAAGEFAAGGFYALQKATDEHVAGIIREIVQKPQTKGSKEQKIRDLYLNITNMQARNDAGLTPIRPYLDELEQVQTVEQLNALQLKMVKELTLGGLLAFELTVDAKDSNKYVLTVQGHTPTQSKEEYQNMDSKNMKGYRTYIKKLLQLGGDSEPQAATNTEAFLAFEKALSERQMDRQDYADVDKTYNVYPIQKVRELFPSVNIDELLTARGFTVPETLIVQDEGLLKAYSEYIAEDHIGLLKTETKLSILLRYGRLLGQDFDDLSKEYQNAAFGIEGSKTLEEEAAIYVQSWMSDYLGELYAARYFTEEAKQDVEAMVQQFISVYKNRIKNLDWMTDATKTMALKKLETMTYKIGYPDSWETPMDNVEIRSAAEGGSFFDNFISIAKESLKVQAARQNEPVDKTGWDLPAYTVNAYYNQSANEIVFPAGILQAPFYDVNAKPEANLGGIGMVIAHEITHAFDNNGAKYDEKGNAANWWTQEDYAAFQKLCDRIVAFYDGQEAAPGITMSGALTLSENIADIGGMSCALEVASALPNPDYDAFFKNNAKIWMMTTSREYLDQLSKTDYHSANKIRSNRVIVNFDEFYQTYDIQETDGMFVPEAQRVKIW